MNKPRLFIFGDSWAFNYFSKTNKQYLKILPHFGNSCVENFASRYNYFGHWIDHIEYFYEVYSYGFGSASNEQIIYQIGNLPKYKKGDRIIIIFTTPERFMWVYDKKIITMLAAGSIKDKFLPLERKKDFTRYNTPEIIKLFNEQYIERYDMWNDTSKSFPQKLFIDFLFVFLSKWKPVFSSWTSDTYSMVESIDPIYLTEKFTSIYTETGGNCKDYHMGISGNYELFKYFSKKLDLDISTYEYKLELKDFNKTIM
jgi:hypothetical protein